MDTIEQAMAAEGVVKLHRHPYLRTLTVHLEDGRIGGGKTFREAIDNAQTTTAYLASIRGEAA